MKATLEIPEKELIVDFDNLTFSQFRMVGRRPSSEIPMIMESYPVGKPITLITSNMPEALNNEITKLIEQYCNH